MVKMKVLLKKRIDLVFNKHMEVENTRGGPNTDFVPEMYDCLGQIFSITNDEYSDYDFRIIDNDVNFGFNIECVEKVIDWECKDKSLLDKFKIFLWDQEIKEIINE